MWYGTAAPASPHPFLRPAYCRWKRPSKLHPRAESFFYLGPGIDHPSDSLRMITRPNKVVATRDVTWEATISTEAPSPRLPEIPKQGGTIDLEKCLSVEGRMTMNPPQRLHCRYWGGEFLTNSVWCLR